jgi:hypothetical protein
MVQPKTLSKGTSVLFDLQTPIAATHPDESQPWKPYEQYFCPRLTIVHWALFNPLSHRLKYRNTIDLSIGEVIVLSLTMCGVVLWIIDISDVGPQTSVALSGKLTSYALALTFATSARTSVLTLLFGLPYERTQVQSVILTKSKIDRLVIHSLLV